MACKRCVDRGKTWDGADPVCAFRDDGSFDRDNWNCATMNALRDLAVAAKTAWRDDSEVSCFGVVWFSSGEDPGEGPWTNVRGYIAMSWYKNRGRTPVAMVFNDDEAPKSLTIVSAEACLSAHADGRGGGCAPWLIE